MIRRKYAPSAKSATGQLAHIIGIRSLPLGAANLFVFQDQTGFLRSITSSRVTNWFSPGKISPFPRPPLYWVISTQTLRIIFQAFQPDDLTKCCGDVCPLYNSPYSQPASHFKHPLNTNASRLYAARNPGLKEFGNCSICGVSK